MNTRLYWREKKIHEHTVRTELFDRRRTSSHGRSSYVVVVHYVVLVAIGSVALPSTPAAVEARLLALRYGDAAAGEGLAGVGAVDVAGVRGVARVLAEAPPLTL